MPKVRKMTKPELKRFLAKLNRMNPKIEGMTNHTINTQRHEKRMRNIRVKIKTKILENEEKNISNELLNEMFNKYLLYNPKNSDVMKYRDSEYKLRYVKQQSKVNQGEHNNLDNLYKQWKNQYNNLFKMKKEIVRQIAKPNEVVTTWENIERIFQNWYPEALRSKDNRAIKYRQEYSKQHKILKNMNFLDIPSQKTQL